MDDSDEDLLDRITAIPSIPPDEYAARTMSELATEPPPPPVASPTSRERETAPAGPRPNPRDTATAQAVPHPRGVPVPPGGRGPIPAWDQKGVPELGLSPSELPTAPPPEGFATERMKTVPRSASVESFSVTQEERDYPNDQPLQLDEKPSLEAKLELDEEPSLEAKLELDEEPSLEAKLDFDSTPAAPSPEQDMKDRFAMGDFSGALEAATRILQTSPSHAEASATSAKCQEVLLDMYTSRIGDMQRSVRVIMAPDQLRWLSLDHRAGFVLSMVDGMSSVDDLLDISGMPRLDALRIVCELLDQRVVELV